MKKLKILIIIATLALPFGCKNSSDPTFITRINADGSCSREILSTADSAFMVGDTAKSNPFRIDLDSTWKVSWSYKTSEFHTNWPLKTWTEDTSYKGQVEVKAVRHYASVAEMDSSFRFAKSDEWHTIKPRYIFNKKFRWFYTYYTYEEVYPKVPILERIPINKYLTNEEAEFWYQGKQDYIKGLNGIEIKDVADDLESKSNKWIFHNILEEQYLLFIEHYDSITGDKADKQRFVLYKDTVINVALSKIEEEKDFSLGKYLDQYFKTKSVYEKYEENSSTFKKKIDSLFGGLILYSGKKVNYNLLMPGKILKAENGVSRGDTLSFKLNTERMIYNSYALGATSRKANTWPFVVTAIIVLLATGSFFVRRK